MAWFYNFNFDENKMYCMPIADLSIACYHKRKIRINKEDDTIPRTTNPYSCGQVYYKVHEFPEIVYKRCFWMKERDDKKAEEIRRRYLEERDKQKEKENGCVFCGDNDKDIFYGEFGGVSISVFINDTPELDLYVSEQGRVLNKTVPIKYCPFCGRRLRG